MKLRFKDNAVEIEGYVNAVERNSNTLASRAGRFVEHICAGAFTRALSRNDDVHILLNHDWEKDLGSTKKGNLELYEDNIGLHVRCEISDGDIVEKARNDELVGWSFGFTDREVETSQEHGIMTRAVKDLDLFEVSLIDNSKVPAYNGTLVTVRSGSDDSEELQFTAEVFNERANTQSEQSKNSEKIDYSEYEQIIKELKEDY